MILATLLWTRKVTKVAKAYNGPRIASDASGRYEAFYVSNSLYEVLERYIEAKVYQRARITLGQSLGPIRHFLPISNRHIANLLNTVKQFFYNSII